jgi:hypothetical protein
MDHFLDFHMNKIFQKNLKPVLRIVKKTKDNNQSFVGLEEPTMKLLLNGSFGSFFNTMVLS